MLVLFVDMINFIIYRNIIPSLYTCCLYKCLAFFFFFVCVCLFVVTKQFLLQGIEENYEHTDDYIVVSLLIFS